MASSIKDTWRDFAGRAAVWGVQYASAKAVGNERGFARLVESLMRGLGYRKRVIDRNLEIAFPEMTPLERKGLRNRFYTSFGRTLAETLACYQYSNAEILSRYRIANPEFINSVIAEHGGLFGATAHHLNWELSLLSCGVTFPDIQVYALYQPLKNTVIDAFMRESRARTGAMLLPSKTAPLTLLRQRQKGWAVALVADQAPAPENAIPARFFGIDTHFHAGPFGLSSKLKKPLLFFGTERIGNRYEGTFTLLGMPDEPAEVVCQRYADAMEASIRKFPEGYLWSHRRFKYEIKY